MIRKEKINDLTYSKVAEVLNAELTKHGFKYLKSKKQFTRQENDFLQIIKLIPYSTPLSFNEETEEIFLLFRVSGSLEIPGYEKWHQSKFQGKSNFRFDTKDIISQIELSFDDFDENSYYTPTPSQRFKHSVTSSLVAGRNANIDIISIEDFLHREIPSLISNLSNNSDLQKVFNSNSHPLKYRFMPFYSGNIELGNETLDKAYQHYIQIIDNAITQNQPDAGQLITLLDVFIKDVKEISEKQFSNPFKRHLKILPDQNEVFEFSPNIKFIETLRLDTTQVGINFWHIEGDGSILMFIENKKIIRLDSSANITFETEITLNIKHTRDTWGIPVGMISGTKSLYANNFILTADNQLIELYIPSEEAKTGEEHSAFVREIIFDTVHSHYYVAAEKRVFIFTRGGAFLKSMSFPIVCKKINLEKQWVFGQCVLCNFKGEKLMEFEANNPQLEISSGLEYSINYGYQTKSWFYDIATGKKSTLWAHPTFIKGYKEILYDDTEHNFGLERVKFSPDQKYIVGGAYHGKYVAWLLPKLERIELIPTQEALDLLEPASHSRLIDGEWTHFLKKAEVVQLEGQTFLKNRMNIISDIIFMENGDFFLTEINHGKLVFSWDRNFNNLSWKSIDGRLALHSEIFLTKRTQQELIIYQKKPTS